MAGFGRTPGNKTKLNNRSSGRPPMALLIGSAVCFLIFIGLALLLFSQGEAKDKPQNTPRVQAKPIQASVPPPPVDMAEVLVPVRDIDAGTQLDPSMLTKSLMPRSQVPANAVRLREEVAGLFARAALPARQPVVSSMLTRERPPNPLAANIPEGFRAVTINVNALTGVEGWARPGARVDVQWIANANKGLSIVPVIQNVKILSAERRLGPNEKDPGPAVPATITLLVTERDAQKISLTQGSGSIVLHLRGPGDNEVLAQNANPLSVKDLLAGVDHPLGNTVEGIAKIRGADGTYEEWAIVDGALVRKDATGNAP